MKDLISECRDWLDHVPYCEFKNSITERVIGQPNLSLILASILLDTSVDEEG